MIAYVGSCDGYFPVIVCQNPLNTIDCALVKVSGKCHVSNCWLSGSTDMAEFVAVWKNVHQGKIEAYRISSTKEHLKLFCHLFVQELMG